VKQQSYEDIREAITNMAQDAGEALVTKGITVDLTSDQAFVLFVSLDGRIIYKICWQDNRS
jgi:hypothetical protein